MSGVGDWTAFEAVDEEVTSAVVSDVYAEFIGIVFSDDAELIENTLASSFSACLSGQILYRIVENDSSVSGLGIEYPLPKYGRYPAAMLSRIITNALS